MNAPFLQHLLRRRAAAVFVLAAAAAFGLFGASAAEAQAVTINYEVSRAGETRANFAEFRSMADQVLNDPRGWSLSGSVRFRRVTSGGRFTVRLTAPGVVGSYAGCSAYYSCRVGRYVMINDNRWRFGTPTYRRLPIDTYRQMVINHEVGHALGFGHASCGRPGARAPVMQQQSKGLDGCRPNPWPLHRERRALAGRLNIPPDTIKPETWLQSGPSGTITQRTATFAFDSNDDSAVYRCRLDGGSFRPCTSPRRYSSLADGRHSLTVKAIDTAGNQDGTPAVRRFRVDATRPETTIRSGPAGPTRDTSARFRFGSSERLSTFRCRLDAGDYRACSSPRTYGGLRDGEHTFRVRAADSAGNVDRRPAIRRFTVDTVTPSVRSLALTPAPFNLSRGRRLDIDFEVDEPAGAYVVTTGIQRLDSGDIIRDFPEAKRSESGPVRYAWNGRNNDGQLVPNGRYAVYITVTDEAGNRAVRRRGFAVTR